MEILVNGTPAVLKKGTSFDYTVENPLFSGAGGYTYSIVFPLADCPQNLAIFGHINRPDVSHGAMLHNCEIRDNRLVLRGALAITQISESEVKAQFLQGRSVQNFDSSFDDIYLDELALDIPARISNRVEKEGQFEQDDPNRWEYVNRYNPTDELRPVSLPYVNPDGEIRRPFRNISSVTHAQHFLVPLIESICRALGYECNIWHIYNNLYFRFLLVCNTIPLAWNIDNYARALPHWTVAEFFEKLELFLVGEFEIDHVNKSVSFFTLESKYNAVGPVTITDILHETSTEVSVDDSNVDYLPMRNVKYAERDDKTYKYDCCPNFSFNGHEQTVDGLPSLTSLLSPICYYDSSDGPPDDCNKLFVTSYNGQRFIMEVTNREQLTETVNGPYPVQQWMRSFLLPRAIGVHNPRIVNSDEDASFTELEIIPVRVEHDGTGKAWYLFLNYNSYNESADVKEEEESEDGVGQTSTALSLANASSDSQSEYYDRLYLAYYPGETEYGPLPFTLPYYFYREGTDLEPSLTYVTESHAKVFDLNLPGGRFSNIRHDIIPGRKTTFKWLSADSLLPDPNALFFIHGKRYICEKITATFSEQGMSQLVTGVFYPIPD